ncbi:uncharacterized protein [Procambarus clarkii]|uniref:uncharacterized protein n=1 Tax=Procambarus clarkii TaxID=6728 RepID=UPI0037432714
MVSVRCESGGSRVLHTRLLLLLLLLAKVSMASICVKSFTWTNDTKSVTLENNGGRALPQLLDVWQVSSTAVINHTFLSNNPPPYTTTINDLPGEGSTKVVDLSAAPPVNPQLCGNYLVCATVMNQPTNATPHYHYKCVSQLKPCVEKVDLQWVVESVGQDRPSLSLAPLAPVSSTGIKLSIVNTGPEHMDDTSAINAPEVMAFISLTEPVDDSSFNFFNTTKSLQTSVKEFTQFNVPQVEFGDEGLIRLPGWELLMIDTQQHARALAYNERLAADLSLLTGPSKLPCQSGILVLLLDPYNRTNDVDRSNNIVMFPIDLLCSGGGDTTWSMCEVIPYMENEGRDAMLLVKDGYNPASYVYKSEGRHRGFMTAKAEDVLRKSMEYNWARERAARLQALNMCPGRNNTMDAAPNNSLIMQAKRLVDKLLLDMKQMKTDSGAEAASHQQGLLLVQLVSDLTGLAMKEDGVWRRLFLRILGARIGSLDICSGATSKGAPWWNRSGGFRGRSQGSRSRRNAYDGFMASPIKQGGQDCNFSCTDGQTVPCFTKCDGKKDCQNGFDELNCTSQGSSSAGRTSGSWNGSSSADDASGQNSWDNEDDDDDHGSGDSSDYDDNDDDNTDRPRHHHHHHHHHEFGRRGGGPPGGGPWGAGPGGPIDPGMFGGDPQARALMTMWKKVELRLASGAGPEDMVELAFLPLSTRLNIKDLYNMFRKDDFSKYHKFMKALMKSGAIMLLMNYAEDNNLNDVQSVLSMSNASAQSLMDFVRKNVSAVVMKETRGMQPMTANFNSSMQPMTANFNSSMQPMAANFNITIKYMQLLVNHRNCVADFIQSVMKVDPSTLCSLAKKSGPSPNRKMMCLRAAQQDVGLMFVNTVAPPEEEDDDDESFFQDPIMEFLKTVKLSKELPGYWLMEKEGVYYGQQNPVTGFYVWDKLAVCSCPGRAATNGQTEWGGHAGWGGQAGSEQGWEGQGRRGGPGGGGGQGRRGGPGGGGGRGRRGGPGGGGGRGRSGGPGEDGDQGEWGGSGGTGESDPGGWDGAGGQGPSNAGWDESGNSGQGGSGVDGRGGSGNGGQGESGNGGQGGSGNGRQDGSRNGGQGGSGNGGQGESGNGGQGGSGNGRQDGSGNGGQGGSGNGGQGESGNGGQGGSRNGGQGESGNGGQGGSGNGGQGGSGNGEQGGSGNGGQGGSRNGGQGESGNGGQGGSGNGGQGGSRNGGQGESGNGGQGESGNGGQGGSGNGGQGESGNGGQGGSENGGQGGSRNGGQGGSGNGGQGGSGNGGQGGSRNGGQGGSGFSGQGGSSDGKQGGFDPTNSGGGFPSSSNQGGSRGMLHGLSEDTLTQLGGGGSEAGGAETRGGVRQHKGSEHLRV